MKYLKSYLEQEIERNNYDNVKEILASHRYKDKPIDDIISVIICRYIEKRDIEIQDIENTFNYEYQDIFNFYNIATIREINIQYDDTKNECHYSIIYMINKKEYTEKWKSIIIPDNITEIKRINIKNK